MPSIDWTTQSASDYHFKQRTVGRQLKFALFPRQCHITKRIMWLEYAYCVTAMYRTDDINFSYEHRWYNKDEYLIARLKDLI
jgi:hypothetical protein